MAFLKNGNHRFFAFIGIWMAAYVCCAGAIAFFYGLGHEATIIFPFRDRSEQGVAVLQTATAAMLIVSWAIWLGLSRRHSRGRMVLIAALAVEASLTICALTGLEVATSHWRSPLDLIFRSTFFAEYNWLTFILEVGPTVSCAVALLLLVALKVDGHKPLVVES